MMPADIAILSYWNYWGEVIIWCNISKWK